MNLNMNAKTLPAWWANSPEDYERLHLTNEVQPWEDGLRTTGVKGEYEWWYFDGKLSDGSSLVIVFYTAPFTAMEAGFHPSLSFTLTRADGSRLVDSYDCTDDDFSFATDHCRAQVGACLFEGDLHTYHIHYEHGDVLSDVELVGNIGSWRPTTGHMVFGGDKYFAWLPSVPEGGVKASVTSNGRTEEYEGTGYHDHNWGNTGMFWLMHHWYWGRAKIGDYQTITSYITGSKKYGYEHFMIFMLARNGEVVADDGRCATFTQTDERFNEKTGKHYHENIAYDYDDGSSHYRVNYHVEDIAEEFYLLDDMELSEAKRNGMQQVMRLAGLDPTYLRLTGTATLERFEGDEVVEKVEAPALWEMMYFGKDADV